jgi:hypothetical protein
MLDKRGHWNPAWKARFCVLTPRGDLEYYKHHTGPGGSPKGTPKGVIPVALRAGCRGDAEETVVRAGREGRRVIELSVRMAGPARGRTYVLRAATEAECDRWMQALRRVAEMWRGDSLARAGSRDVARSPSAASLGAPSPSPSASPLPPQVALYIYI